MGNCSYDFRPCITLFIVDLLGTIRATVMIETLPGCFEMEEMLYELRDYACAMNAGRWDYIFSLIKVLKARGDCVLPDRKQVSLLYCLNFI